MSFHQSSTLKRHRKTDIFHEMPFEKSLFLQVTPVAMMTMQKALSRKEFCSYLFTSFLAVFRMGRRRIWHFSPRQNVDEMATNLVPVYPPISEFTIWTPWAQIHNEVNFGPKCSCSV